MAKPRSDWKILFGVAFLVFAALNCHAAPPANDLCSGAVLIPTNGPFPYTTAAVDTSQATTNGDPGVPSCFSAICHLSRSIWYKFSPGTSANYTFTTCAASNTIDDPIMAVYSATGSCGILTEISCNDDDFSCGNGCQSSLTQTLTAGTQYYIIVWYQACGCGSTEPPTSGRTTNQLRITSAPLPQPPTNNTCSGAITIPATGPFPYLTSTQDIAAADTTGDRGLPVCQSNVSRSVWYKFLPSTTGTYSFTTCAPLTTVPDTVMALYSATGSCTNFTPIDCNDDNDVVCPDNPAQAAITHQLNSGTQYYIVVWQYSTAPPPPGGSTLQLHVSASPTNNICTNAITIPASGPFPYSTSTQDVSVATTTGDPPLPSCDANVSHSIWYKFTPSVTTMYEFSVCTNNTATTAPNTVMAIYTSANATNPCAGPLTEISTDGLSTGCDDGTCDGGAIVTTQLSNNTTYYIVVWLYGQDQPAADSANVQLRVNRGVPPLNNLCDNATTLTLDSPINGTTLTASNTYQISTACYSGLSNVASIAAGRDVAYLFTVPFADNYSFRVSNYTNDLVLYLASDCPSWTGGPAVTVASCLAAANRTTTSGAEEVMCLPLDPFVYPQVYVYVDGASSTAASTFTLEVNQCVAEIESNDATDIANDLACGIEGSINTPGDVDFYSLGTWPVGSRVFALLDTAAANSNTNFELRVTTDTDTLQYALSNNVAGTPLTSVPAFLRVNHKSAAIAAEPYRLYALVQPPSSSATLESEPNNTTTQANTSASNYFSGKLSSTNDVDTFALNAGVANLLFLSLDENPARTNGPIRVVLALLDSNGVVLASVSNPATNATTISGAGSLTSTNPVSPAQGLIYRTRYKGTYYARVSAGTNTVGAGDYLLSISKFCLTGANLPPVADDQNVGVSADYSTMLTLTGSDPEQEPITFQVISQPTHGLLSSPNMSTGEIVYTPAHGYVGDDSFTFIVNDGTNNSAPGTIDLLVSAQTSTLGDGIPDYWRTNYFVGNGTTTNNQSCATCDPDHDGMNNLQEYLANTNPTNTTSVFRIVSVTRNASGQPTLTWSSVGGTRYRVEYSNGGASGGYNGVYTDIVLSVQIEMDPNPIGTAGTRSFTDDYSQTGGPPPSGARFYRIKVVQ